MNSSRRRFLQSALPRFRAPMRTVYQNNLVKLGKLNDFPVNSQTEIKIFDIDFIIKSLPQGLQLLNKAESQGVCLSLDSEGQITADMSQSWPSNAVLSIFSGELYNLLEEHL
ncbi:MAG: hypothetical protein IT289_13420 [Oligoflexia bacterium]|nr:hypothetical protein [Oligoflexia bacterium]